MNALANMADISRFHDLSWREYRRLLLNCFPRDDHDQTNSAQFYVSRVQRMLTNSKLSCDALYHMNSYESMTKIGTTLYDMNMDGSVAMLSSLVGLGLGMAGYVQLFKRFHVKCPPNRLMVMYWKHRGIHVENRLFGLIKDRSYLRVKPSWECFMFQPQKIPLLRKLDMCDMEHCVGYILLEKVPLHMNFEVLTRDQHRFILRSSLVVQVLENETDRHVADNAVRLANMNPAQVAERANVIIEEGVREMVSHIDYHMIAEDPGTFVIFLEQTMGHYLRLLGLRTIQCNELLFVDEEAAVKAHVRNVS